jgi:hypothetical protein
METLLAGVAGTILLLFFLVLMLAFVVRAKHVIVLSKWGGIAPSPAWRRQRRSQPHSVDAGLKEWIARRKADRSGVIEAATVQRESA